MHKVKKFYQCDRYNAQHSIRFLGENNQANVGPMDDSNPLTIVVPLSLIMSVKDLLSLKLSRGFRQAKVLLQYFLFILM